MRSKNLFKIIFLIIIIGIYSNNFIKNVDSATSTCLSYDGLNAILCSNNQKIITLDSDKLYCENRYYGRKWINSSGEYSSLEYDPPEKLGCFLDKSKVEDLSNNKCCPAGTECVISRGPNGDYGERCTTTNIHQCSDYKNKKDCENDIASVAVKSVEDEYGDNFCSDIVTIPSKPTCYKTRDCSCIWDNGVCKSKWKDLIPSGQDSTCYPPNPSPNGCIDDLINADTSSCKYPGGVAIYTYKSTPIGNPDPPCKNGKVEIPCSNLTRLPFFNYLNLTITLVIIFISYIFGFLFRFKYKKI